MSAERPSGAPSSELDSLRNELKTLKQAIGSPPANSLLIHERLWEATDGISGVLGWAEAASIWLVSLPVIFVASLFWHQVLEYAYLDLIVGGGIFLFSGAFNILQTHRAKGVLEEWESKMLPFFYTVKFELLPIQESTREQDILKRFQSLYPALSPHKRHKIGLMGGPPEVKFDSQIKGKEGKHNFSIAACNSEIVFLVRRFGGSNAVTLADLRTLQADAVDVARYVRPSNLVIAAFATAGFTPEAVEFARSEESMVVENWIDLLQETASGYRVVSVLTD
jgi:hypothetical protein